MCNLRNYILFLIIKFFGYDLSEKFIWIFVVGTKQYRFGWAQSYFVPSLRFSFFNVAKQKNICITRINVTLILKVTVHTTVWEALSDSIGCVWISCHTFKHYGQIYFVWWNVVLRGKHRPAYNHPPSLVHTGMMSSGTNSSVAWLPQPLPLHLAQDIYMDKLASHMYRDDNIHVIHI